MSQDRLDILKQEIIRLKIDVLGINELHWMNNGYFQYEKFAIYYIRHKNMHRNGVVIITSKQMAQAVEASP